MDTVFAVLVIILLIIIMGALVFIAVCIWSGLNQIINAINYINHLTKENKDGTRGKSKSQD